MVLKSALKWLRTPVQESTLKYAPCNWCIHGYSPALDKRVQKINRRAKKLGVSTTPSRLDFFIEDWLLPLSPLLVFLYILYKTCF